MEKKKLIAEITAQINEALKGTGYVLKGEIEIISKEEQHLKNLQEIFSWKF